MFDIAFVGHFTKDTIVNEQGLSRGLASRGSSVHLGGAYYYGCHVTARMGLNVAVVTRLALEDVIVVDELRTLGVTVFPTFTPQSTNLRIVYPTSDLDRRAIYATGFAGAFTPAEVGNVDARVFHVGASIRGEVPTEVVHALHDKGASVSLDVQGFIRVNRDGELVSAPWPEMPQVLALVNVLKTDISEVTYLTGQSDMRKAATALAALGPQEVIVTHNAGVLVLANGQFYEEPWLVREIKGRTGRGDTCTAAYLGKRLTSGPAEATRFAAAVTGRKLEAPGPFKGDISEIERLLSESMRQH
jgi:sugar/nucleoside kinase (ribokinase family)